MLPMSWKPVPVQDLVRVGPASDGGYVAAGATLAPVTLLLSMGLNDDWRFEEEFHARTGASILCFDGSVDTRFWVRHAIRQVRARAFGKALDFFRYRRFFSRPGISHRRQMIGFDGPGTVSLSTILAEVSDAHIFLKMDIEGGEYRILDQIVEHRARFTGIVMELHDVDLHRDRIARFFEAMREFVIVALYPNNVGGVDRQGDPVLIEISMARADYVVTAAGAEAPVPLPNNPAIPNIALRYAT